ncbi:MAG: septum formation family protein [Nocardioides sp.]|uniref:septum formation family protein n=1 Tax=Nocardioides sp. TaxID=35761 RepID=UPI0039E37931
MISLTRVLLAVVTVWAVAGCSGDNVDSASKESAAADSSAAASPSASSARPSAAPEPARPKVGSCYRLAYRQALAPTNTSAPRPCEKPHTAVTYAVGDLDTVVDGHLLAVDATRVRDQVAAACPGRLLRFLGGSEEQLRLTSLHAVWFSPTLKQADRGQNWFRCDLIALGGDRRLAPLPDRLKGVLTTEAGRRAVGVCGTTEPGTPTFTRVICSAPHTWRAISSYDVRGDAFPGTAKLQAEAQSRCKPAVKAQADDPLDFQWGYDWPTREQWRAGQHYGLCWAPEG